MFPGGPQPPHHQRTQRADTLPRHGRSAGDAPHAQPSEDKDLPHPHEVEEPDAEEYVQVGQIGESDRVEVDGRVERRKSLEERGPPRRDAERYLGKPRREMRHHVPGHDQGGRPEPELERTGAHEPRKRTPVPLVAGHVGGHLRERVHQAVRTPPNCRRRITIRHIEANANAPTRAIHQVNGPAQAPRGIGVSLDGRPSNSIRIVPPRFDGAIQSGMWRWEEGAPLVFRGRHVVRNRDGPQERGHQAESGHHRAGQAHRGHHQNLRPRQTPAPPERLERGIRKQRQEHEGHEQPHGKMGHLQPGSPDQVQRVEDPEVDEHHHKKADSHRPRGDSARFVLGVPGVWRPGMYRRRFHGSRFERVSDGRIRYV